MGSMYEDGLQPNIQRPIRCGATKKTPVLKMYKNNRLLQIKYQSPHIMLNHEALTIFNII